MHGAMERYGPLAELLAIRGGAGEAGPSRRGVHERPFLSDACDGFEPMVPKARVTSRGR